ncbi:MAG TPA: hypothetical protein VHW23_24405 [Kofleriaceae bacterium]|jgi:hypothetical protein|nr:hypothetical protein [Kofleriaceae bacterium]
MYLLELIIPFLDEYLTGLAASSERLDGDSGRLLSGFAPRTTPFGSGSPYPPLRDVDGNLHHIEVELIGPRGTCMHCQAALREYRNSVTREFSRTRTGTQISIVITTRYTEDDRKKYVRRFAKRYGSHYAHEVTYHSKRRRWRLRPHWALHIGRPLPHWQLERQRATIKRMRDRAQKRRQQKFDVKRFQNK